MSAIQVVIRIDSQPTTIVVGADGTTRRMYEMVPSSCQRAFINHKNCLIDLLTCTHPNSSIIAIDRKINNCLESKQPLKSIPMEALEDFRLVTYQRHKGKSEGSKWLMTDKDVEDCVLSTQPRLITARWYNVEILYGHNIITIYHSLTFDGAKQGIKALNLTIDCIGIASAFYRYCRTPSSLY
jgi:hypothetical protein